MLALGPKCNFPGSSLTRVLFTPVPKCPHYLLSGYPISISVRLLAHVHPKVCLRHRLRVSLSSARPTCRPSLWLTCRGGCPIPILSNYVKLTNRRLSPLLTIAFRTSSLPLTIPAANRKAVASSLSTMTLIYPNCIPICKLKLLPPPLLTLLPYRSRCWTPMTNQCASHFSTLLTRFALMPPLSTRSNTRKMSAIRPISLAFRLSRMPRCISRCFRRPCFLLICRQICHRRVSCRRLCGCRLPPTSSSSRTIRTAPLRLPRRLIRNRMPRSARPAEPLLRTLGIIRKSPYPLFRILRRLRRRLVLRIPRDPTRSMRTRRLGTEGTRKTAPPIIISRIAVISATPVRRGKMLNLVINRIDRRIGTGLEIMGGRRRSLHVVISPGIDVVVTPVAKIARANA